MPWGKTRYTSGDPGTNHRYTGQSLEPDLGLYYYGARWYDPVLGRFVSLDTIIPDPKNPKAFDRYGYAYNNPIHFSDPTGHRPDDGCRTEGCDPKEIAYAELKLAQEKCQSGNRSGCNNPVEIAVTGVVGIVGIAALGVVASGGIVVSSGTAGTAATVGGAAQAANTACAGDMCVDDIENALPIIEQHLKQFGYNPENEAMLERIRSGLWTAWDQRFAMHELLESQAMDLGLSSIDAHGFTLAEQGIKLLPGYEAYLYHPEVINSLSEYFSPAAKYISSLFQ
jgi:RHS repeat-associated protein